jgi:hypothetical protein
VERLKGAAREVSRLRAQIEEAQRIESLPVLRTPNRRRT